MMKRYLFYITENYSFEILRPLQKEILVRGGVVYWLVSGKNVSLGSFHANEKTLNSIDDAVKYNPDACFIPGNLIPNFIPGLKVQVFHGLEWKKKGHFQVRGFFDLYCTHGKATTSRFKTLASKHGYFDVIETGWPKIDPLFNTPSAQYFETKKTTILYAPTFSPKLTSAPDLFDEMRNFSLSGNYNCLVKFHPKMDNEWVKKYQALNNDSFKVVSSSDINQLFQTADILVSDTSSVIGEFALLGKPVVTYKNSKPGDYLINIESPSKLVSAIDNASSPSSALKLAIKHYTDDLHPYKDGQSSSRILDAVEKILKDGKDAKKRKPLNIFRSFKLRKKLNYWKI